MGSLITYALTWAPPAALATVLVNVNVDPATSIAAKVNFVNRAK
jgi:hypothetical protein